MEKEICFVIFVLVNTEILVYGEIRCYCNESGCVRTGYLCKSDQNSCYTLVTVKNDMRESVHGCIDSLSADDRKLCAMPSRLVTRVERDTHAVSCCGEDMCNYKSAIDINIVVRPQTSNLSSSTVEDEANGPWPKKSASGGRDKHIWFKAAVIAVPISGGCILVILILLAVRMLRMDTRRHRQLMDIRNKLAYANSYVTRHFCDDEGKSNAHARLLNTGECICSACPYRDIYGNVHNVKAVQPAAFSTNTCENMKKVYAELNVHKIRCCQCRFNQLSRNHTHKLASINKNDVNVLKDDLSTSSEPVETSLFFDRVPDSNETGCDPVPV